MRYKINKRGKINLTILGIALYVFLICNVNVIIDHVLEGSTIYCYQNNISDAWWMNR